jgi:hypothetical protein
MSPEETPQDPSDISFQKAIARAQGYTVTTTPAEEARDAGKQSPTQTPSGDRKTTETTHPKRSNANAKLSPEAIEHLRDSLDN